MKSYASSVTSQLSATSRVAYTKTSASISSSWRTQTWTPFRTGRTLDYARRAAHEHWETQSERESGTEALPRVAP
jgi:hypothetical protein